MTHETIRDRAAALQAQMVAWRRDIHQHPELGFQETRTAQLVANALRGLGLEVEVGIAKTGVVAHLMNGEGPVVGIRADMDALPIHENNPELPFASQTPGVMHACGHDAHTAILLGVAHILHDLPDLPAGEIRFLFQPCEETQDDENKSGGLRMTEENALAGVDHTLALHVASHIESGAVLVAEGPITAAVDSFEAVIKGKGCHGAASHLGIDPIYILAQVINAIHGIRARRIDPAKAATISIGSVHGGDANNVIPHEVRLNGTIRTYDPDVREQIRHDLYSAFDVARALGGDYELHLQPGYPPTINDAGAVRAIEASTVDMFGAEAMQPGEAILGGEDFSYMTQAAPGAMFFLGAKYDDQERPHHSPVFNIDEAVLQRGAAVLAESALRLMRQ
ncbi:MAG: M20 family metallopeptidase [Anaerolineales bacterium]